MRCTLALGTMMLALTSLGGSYAMRVPCTALSRSATPPARSCAIRCSDVDDDGGSGLPAISIEYCTGCNWMLRATWLAQELLTTFDGTLEVVSLVPNYAGNGIFEVELATKDGEVTTVWSRKGEGRFPEAKELKQRVRDKIDPDKSLGHSDTDDKKKGGGRQKLVSRVMSMLRLDRGARGDDSR